MDDIRYMPFTTAHTALVIPLKKFWPGYVSLTGLMAGAMAPDMIYFLQLTTTSRGLGHSWSGLVMFCLPLGIAFSFVFHWLFKYNFISNLPSPFDRALSGLATSSFTVVGVRSWSVLILSILLGTLSHFFWDSFTHQDGVLAKAIPFLTQHTTLFGHSVLNARLAQHFSTVIGTVGLAVGLWKAGVLPAAQAHFSSRNPRSKLRFWLSHSAVAIVFAGLVVATFDYFFPDHPVGTRVIFGLSGWAGFFYSVVIYTLTEKIRKSVIIFTDSR